jgi:hypothetical protein
MRTRNRRSVVRGWALAGLALVSACGFSDDAKDLGEIFFRDGGEIRRDALGVQNEFVPNPKGGASAQAADIRTTLGIRHVRTTFFFDEGFLASEGAQPNWARFDAIVNAIPSDVDLLPILAYAPGWLANRPDWKTVFVNRYVIPVLERYGSDSRIGGWEIWNEPDGFCNGRGGAPAGVLDCSAEDYVDLVRLVAPAIRARSSAPIVGAATTAINQSFPRHLDFNRAMVSNGLLDLIDVYNFHWYGEQFERFTLGVESFLNGTGKPVWCTESGERGSTRQLGYAEDAFPLFEDRIDRLERIYVYTYYDGEPPETTYGLVAGDGTESSLYQFLRDES